MRLNQPIRTREDRAAIKFSSLGEVTDRDWEVIFRELCTYTQSVLIRNRKDKRVGDAVALLIIKSVRDGSREWNPAEDSHLLLFLFSVARFSASDIADQISGDQSKFVSKYSDRREKEGRSGRHRRRGSGVLNEIATQMDTPAVVKNLPMIALLIRQLNDLLNPVDVPIDSESDEEFSLDDRVEITPLGRDALEEHAIDSGLAVIIEGGAVRR